MSAPPRAPAAAARGLRREVPALLAGSLLVFVALAAFTLLSYRAAVANLLAERRLEAARVAERLAGELGRGGASGIEALARRLPPGAALALLDGNGRAEAAFGFDASADLVPLPAAARSGPLQLDPDAERPAVVALAPYGAGAARRFVRVDLPARSLAAQKRALRILSPTVVGLSLAAALLLLASARALTRPVDRLLERARAAGAPAPGGDEVEFLLATFDRALAALGGEPAAGRGAEPEAIHAALAPQVDSGLLLLDRDGRLLAANPSAAELLELAPPFEGEPVAAALARHGELARALSGALAAGAALPRGEARIARAAGAATVGFVAEPLRAPNGTARGWLVLVADVTEMEREAARTRLSDGLVQLGELSAGVAHELRNGVAALSGWLELARKRETGPELAELHDEMARELGQLARVVGDFLLFARPGTRRLEPVDLAARAARAARDPSWAGVEIRVVDAAPKTRLTGDPELLERAVKNLLANSVEAERAAGRSGPVEVTIEERPGELLLAVEDRGPGLPPALAARLFQPFVSGRPGGAGLGLALCRRIVLLHSGDVSLAPREGGGVRAEIRLPLDTSVTKSS